MFDKIINVIKKIFKINSELYLPQTSFEGISNNYGNVSPLKIFKFENSDNSNFTNNPIISDTADDIIDPKFIGIDLLSYIQNGEKDKDLDDIEEKNTIDNDSEEKFEYDIKKAKQMNKLIDYYKKNLDELYNIPLNEIMEINFYYKKRIENLEKKVRKA